MARSLSEMLISMIPSGDQNMQGQRLAAARAAGQISPAVAMREGVQFQPNINRIQPNINRTSAAAHTNAPLLRREAYTPPDGPANSPVMSRPPDGITVTPLPPPMPLPGTKPTLTPEQINRMLQMQALQNEVEAESDLMMGPGGIPYIDPPSSNMTLQQVMQTFPMAYGMRGMY